MARFRNQRQFQRSSRPNRGWAASNPAVTVAVPPASKVLLASLVLDNDGIDETILRNVGVVGIASDQVAANEFQFGAVGMCLVTDTALALGITAIPDPVTNGDDDIWMFYQSFVQNLQFLSSVGI